MKKNYGAFLFSTFLYLVTGYGQRLRNISITYVGLVLFLACIHYLFGLGTEGAGIEALGSAFTKSLKAFHDLDVPAKFSWQGVVTRVEGLFGLVIEATFIGMLVHRLRMGNGD
jgi:hypothetical protein